MVLTFQNFFETDVFDFENIEYSYLWWSILEPSDNGTYTCTVTYQHIHDKLPRRRKIHNMSLLVQGYLTEPETVIHYGGSAKNVSLSCRIYAVTPGSLSW